MIKLKKSWVTKKNKKDIKFALKWANHSLTTIKKKQRDLTFI